VRVTVTVAAVEGRGLVTETERFFTWKFFEFPLHEPL
jgi:hypothetical protein